MVAALLVLGMSPAAANTPPDGKAFSLDVPKGWQRLADDSAKLTATAKATSPFGKVRFDSGVDAYQGPDAALVVTWAGALDAMDDYGSGVRRALNSLREAHLDARMDRNVATTEEVTWTETLTKGVADARSEWKHKGNGTVTTSRMLVHVSAGNYPRLVRAECLFPQTATAEARKQCQSALASLALTGAKGGPLTEIPKAAADNGEDGAGASGDADTQGLTPPPGMSKPPRPSASMRPADTGMPPGGVIMQRKPKKKSKSRQWLLILGAALIVIAFYYTTRSRAADSLYAAREAAREEAEDEGETGAEAETEGEDETGAEAETEGEGEGEDEGEAEDEGSGRKNTKEDDDE